MQKRVTRILDAHYVQADLKEVVKSQGHLTDEEKLGLAKVLNEFEHLFDGTLGKWKGSGVSFELKKDAVPYQHARPYPIPHIHEEPTRLKSTDSVDLGCWNHVMIVSGEPRHSSYRRRMELFAF